MTKVFSLKPQLLKLKINLEHMPVPVFRKVLVPVDFDMLQLHVIIQMVMGWENYHLFQFQNRKDRPEVLIIDRKIESDDWGFDIFGSNVEKIPFEEALLYDVFDNQLNRAPFWYWYDFGDDWWHKITFQKVTKKDLSQYKGRPICLEQVGACPPEDCGGSWGYMHLLEMLKENSQEAREKREWMGLYGKARIDPSLPRDSLENINMMLAREFE